MDHYEFVDESEGRSAPNFNDSFHPIFNQDSGSEDEDFTGFQAQDVLLGERVEAFHKRKDEARFADKENILPSNRPKKRVAKPERYSSNASNFILCFVQV